MADFLIPVSLMFAGAGLALSGFALGQLVERRRWMAWVRPAPKQAPGVTASCRIIHDPAAAASIEMPPSWGRRDA